MMNTLAFYYTTLIIWALAAIVASQAFSLTLADNTGVPVAGAVRGTPEVTFNEHYGSLDFEIDNSTHHPSNWQRVYGDPHFVIASVNAEEHTYLCFDVDGEEKDVLMLLQDPDLELQVNGELYESHSGKLKQAFFSAIAVMHDEDEIIATNRNITINGVHTFQWEDSYSLDLSSGGYVSSVDHSKTKIKLNSHVEMQISRSKTLNNGTSLGLLLTRSGGIGDRAAGIMGKFIRSKFTAIPSIDEISHGVVEFSELPISIPVERVTRYRHSRPRKIECWLYNVDSDASEDDLLGRRSDYTVDHLKYTPFHHTTDDV